MHIRMGVTEGMIKELLIQNDMLWHENRLYDGVCSSQSNEDAQTSLVSLNSVSKVHRITHILQEDQMGTYEYKSDFKPGFVFLIT